MDCDEIYCDWYHWSWRKEKKNGLQLTQFVIIFLLLDYFVKVNFFRVQMIQYCTKTLTYILNNGELVNNSVVYSVILMNILPNEQFFSLQKPQDTNFNNLILSISFHKCFKNVKKCEWKRLEQIICQNGKALWDVVLVNEYLTHRLRLWYTHTDTVYRVRFK